MTPIRRVVLVFTFILLFLVEVRNVAVVVSFLAVGATCSVCIVSSLWVDLESSRVKKLRQHAILVHGRLGQQLRVVVALSICTRAHVALEVDSTAIHSTDHLLSRLAYSMHIEHGHWLQITFILLCIPDLKVVRAMITCCILTKDFTIRKTQSILSYRY